MIVHSVAFPSSSAALGIVVPARIIDALDNSFREYLQRTSFGFFEWVLISAFVVAIGVILEGPEILYELWPSLFSWFTWTSNERAHKFERAIKKIAFVGWFLIGIGVLGEGVFEELQYRAEGQLQTFDFILLKDARLTASTAKQSATYAEASARATDALLQQAQARVDVLGREADTLIVRMGETRKAVAFLAPRRLILLASAPKIVPQLKPYARQKVGLYMCENADSETSDALEVLVNILGPNKPDFFGANWKEVPMSFNLVRGGCGGTGITVLVGTGASEQTRKAGKALSDALFKFLPPSVNNRFGESDPAIVQRQRISDKGSPLFAAAHNPDLVTVQIDAHPVQ